MTSDSCIQFLVQIAESEYHTDREEVRAMETALRHWLFHMEWPHARREWKTEVTQMVHDHYFWGTVAVIACTVLFVGLILWGMTTTGPPSTTAPTAAPMSWPYMPLYYH
jgi:hypothetical protein